MYSLKCLLPVLVTVSFAVQAAAPAEKVFGVYPRYVIPAPLATNAAQYVFLPNALNLRFGMSREDVIKTCPILEYDGEFGRKYFLRFTRPIILQNELKGIEFSGGFPSPSREIVSTTVEWLLCAFGAPDTAFEESTRDGGRFGMIWKRSDFAVACWFDSSEFGKRFYAFLKLVPPASNMERILSSRGGRPLPKNSQSILTSLKIWAGNVARLESRPPVPPLPATPLAGRPAASLASLEKYEVLSGEGLAGSGFVIRHQNNLYGVCSIHQFEGKTPNSLETIQGAAIPLDKSRVIRQKDVQAIPLKVSQQTFPFLAYNPDFTLGPGEEFFILGPSGGVELGILATQSLAAGAYKSAQGPRQFTVRMAKPFTAGGGSGCPILQKSTGAVVGVLLSADDAAKARVVEFETLCLPR